MVYHLVYLEYLKKCYDENLTVDNVIHEHMMKLFNLYVIVGGLPEVVYNYI